MTGEHFAAWGLSDLVSKGGVAVAAVFSSGCRPSLGICMSLLNSRLRCQVLGGRAGKFAWGDDTTTCPDVQDEIVTIRDEQTELNGIEEACKYGCL